MLNGIFPQIEQLQGSTSLWCIIQKVQQEEQEKLSLLPASASHTVLPPQRHPEYFSFPLSFRRHLVLNDAFDSVIPRVPAIDGKPSSTTHLPFSSRLTFHHISLCTGICLRGCKHFTVIENYESYLK